MSILFEIIYILYFIIALIISIFISIFLKVNVNKNNFNFLKTFGIILFLGLCWPLMVIFYFIAIEEERII